MPQFSRLRPDSATMVGLLTAVGVYLIYNNALPSAADVRVAMPHDETIEATRKHAAYKSAGLVALVFLVSRDLNSYIISGAALFGVDYMYKHNNAINPNTGKIDTSDQPQGAPTDNVTAFPMPDYSESVAE